jgi:hypothetical protein
MRGQMRLMLCRWFNVQGFKAWNAWKSQYQQRVANRSKSKSQASMMRNKQDDNDEEFLSNPLAETRALQRLVDRRSGNGHALSEDEVPRPQTTFPYQWLHSTRFR